MFSHFFSGVTDFERAFAFYAPLMEGLGHELRFHEPERPWAGWHGEGGSRPLFVICRANDGQPHHPGNGQMLAFMAMSRAQVRSAYAIALRNGGACEGPPGLRRHYHPDYYGAYVRDPDGNKVGLACHLAEAESTLAGVA